ANHNFVAGQTVVIAGITPAGYNGTFTIATVPTATTFTYTDPTSGLAASTVAGTALSPGSTGANIQSALAALSNVGSGNVSVTTVAASGANQQLFQVTFQGALAGTSQP